MKPTVDPNPLKSLDEWEEDVLKRYPDPDTIASEKSTEEYRNYDNPQRDTVREFYRLNHTYQTYDFVMEKRANFLKFDKKEMPIWPAFDFLNQLVAVTFLACQNSQHQRHGRSRNQFFGQHRTMVNIAPLGMSTLGIDSHGNDRIG